jgi:hypothetical protein
MRTSTGEQRQAGHGTATNSGLSNRGSMAPKRTTCSAREQPSRSWSTHTVAWSAMRPLASARPLAETM